MARHRNPQGLGRRALGRLPLGRLSLRQLPLGQLLVRPALWPVAVRLAWRLRFVPDPAYVRFRMVTMYGDGGAVPDAGDFIAYLRWCRAWSRVY